LKKSSSSIAVRLFVLVFGFSFAWFTFITGVQMLLEYRNTRIEVDSNLEDLFLATREGMESALWNYDVPLVQASLEATRPVRYLSGAAVRDEKGLVLASWGQPLPPTPPDSGERENVEAWDPSLYHQFPLRYRTVTGRSQQVGMLVLVSGPEVLWLRLAEAFRLMLSNYLASTLGLMLILILGLHRLVARPLQSVTQAIGAYRFDRVSLPPPGNPLRLADELSVLWESFQVLTSHLKESWLQQRVMSAILEEAAVMALVCDADGRIVSSNAQARLRLSDGQPGGTLARLSYGDHLTPLFDDVPQLLRAGTAWRGEVSAPGDGQTYWLSAALLPLDVTDDPQARWGVMIEDISAQKLTDQYRHERDVAQESTRAKSLFLANLSHEIRTPMNAVVGLTALALKEDLSPRVRDYLAPLERSAKALLAILTDILDFSKLEEGKAELETVDFSLDTLVGDVGAMARFRAEEKGLVFSIHLSPDLPPVLRGDPLRLQQVLLNLVSNAVKFTSHGSVSLRVSPMAEVGPRGPFWRFEVRDTGIGIAPADQERLFESFTQLDSSTTRLYGGTGLGLSIARQLVVLMGGRLGIDSALGQGSLFWVELPLALGAPTVDQARPAWKGLEGLRVLLAEDNKVNQLVAREILLKVGITPVVVDDGSHAVAKVEAEDFDLVLMDLQMPLMDGLEASRRIRRLRSAESLPILAMTAHTFAQEHSVCLEAGMQDLVPKPVDPDQLYAALTRWRPGASKT